MTDRLFEQEPVLLAELRKDNKKAFAWVYDRYYIGLFCFVRRWVREQKAAEDVTTETFIKCWERRARFDSLDAVQAFLHVTARNACLNHLRSLARSGARERAFTEWLAQEDRALAREDGPSEDSLLDHVCLEAERLPPQLRRVFKLSFIDGLSNQTIADQLHINNQSVCNHKARALQYLRAALVNKDVYKLWLLTALLQKFWGH
ncbi:MAG TPA: sigma-70 family RNA polymerase sigma factor [Dinghuibacter sp.]|uniref:sigma-70 family RNA polymerase sigma factor n=1 Tax=Dinghuibacter sp. TaxID=2024697 RepID=UPI002BB0E022|nr:sigma-70 family RNA polymerase sigma factor [Dinghuibacter sp.]HTJ11788.1 sigma-70 family RNA polymerase sigma factor [Dinghuibacter sp.]